MNRCTACALIGLAACTHLTALAIIEAIYPRQPEARPSITVDALPVDPDHTHRDYDRNVRNIGPLYTDVSTSGVRPPGRRPMEQYWFLWRDPADSRHPAYDF